MTMQQRVAMLSKLSASLYVSHCDLVKIWYSI